MTSWPPPLTISTRSRPSVKTSKNSISVRKKHWIKNRIIWIGLKKTYNLIHVPILYLLVALVNSIWLVEHHEIDLRSLRSIWLRYAYDVHFLHLCAQIIFVLVSIIWVYWNNPNTYGVITVFLTFFGSSLSAVDSTSLIDSFSIVFSSFSLSCFDVSLFSTEFVVELFTLFAGQSVFSAWNIF